MCGRFYVEPSEDAQEATDVRPTDENMVLTDRGWLPMRWGFVRVSGGIGKSGGTGSGVVINARSETAAQKPMFSESYMQRRIVIRARGFYEWRRVGERRAEGYRLFRPDGKPLWLAGVYKPHAIGGAAENRFVILTAPANPSVSPLHDRMPVILREDAVQDWLQKGEESAFELDVKLDREPICKDGQEQLTFF